MKKRSIGCFLLAIILVMQIIPMTSIHAAEGEYGSVPILTGYMDVDYMASVVLSEIKTDGLSNRNKIQAVYDWIIAHCKRNNWDGTYYFDPQEVETHLDAYWQSVNLLLQQKKVVLRPEWELFFELSSSDSFFLSYDSNAYIATFAYNMMLTRTGNCAHFSSLFAVLLGQLGFDCRLIPGEFINKDGTRVEHKWNYVLVDGQYYWFDIRIDHAISTPTNIKHQYFMKSDTNAWAKEHVWDQTYSTLLAQNAGTIQSLYREYLHHTHELIEIDRVEPTCVSEGKLTKRCTVCGAIYESKLPAKGHSWGGPLQTVEPTCTRDGSKKFSCSACGAQKTDRVPALGHDFEKGVCARCGYEAQKVSEVFSDVKDKAYYADAVFWAIRNGITSGTGNGKFSPKDSCTRAQVVTFLWSAEGRPASEIEHLPFTDVKHGQWYEKAVCWAYQEGITSGVDDTHFCPKGKCSRAEIVTFLWSAKGKPEPVTETNPFEDVKRKDWYYKAVLWAYEQGITKGTDSTHFSPKKICSRAEAVTFLYNVFGES